MNRVRNGSTLFLIIGLIIFGLLSQTQAQSRPSQKQTNDLLRRLNVKVDEFRNNLYDELNNVTISHSDEDQINDSLERLQNDLTNFQSKVDRRRDSQDDVSRILSTAKNIDDFVSRNRFGSRLQRSWTDSRALFDQLASSYNLTFYSSNGGSQYPNSGNYPRGNSFGNNLTGTYQIDTSRSDDTREIADKAINGIDAQRRDDARADLEEKLRAPDQLTIDVQGNQVTLASNLAAQITFTADGQDRNETLPDGRTVRLRTTLRGQQLTVSNAGGDNDYTVTFLSTDNGNSLKVSKRITTDYLNQTIFSDTFYTKTDSNARLDIYGNQDNSSTTASNGNYPNGNYPNGNYPSGNPPIARPAGNGQFIVPNGTILTGNLENNISTKYSQNNDRFRLTVTAPNQYQGAVIEGYVTGINRSGKVSGRSQLTFNFESIRLTNGNTYGFAGFLQSVTDTDGKTIQVDTEGTAKGGNQTKQTATRGAIGAGIGAIIGAIAGGGKGAAIGAILGGGAGAGSVYVQGQDDLELKSGSSITVQSSSPSGGQ